MYKLKKETVWSFILAVVLSLSLVPEIARGKKANENPDQEKIDALIQKGDEYFVKAQYQEALKNYNQALELSRQIRDGSREALSLNSHGIVYYRVGRYDEALGHYKQSLEIFRRIEDLAGESSSLVYIGLVYDSQGQYSEALEYYEQSLEIKRQIGDVGGVAGLLGNIGLVYDSLGYYSKALEHYQQALEIFGKIEDARGKARSLNNIGGVHYQLSRYTEALEYYQKSLEISRRIGDVIEEAYSLNNMGAVYDNLGRYNEALEHYQKSLEIKRKMGDVAGEASSLNNIGGVYDNLGRYAETLTYLEQSLEISRKIGDVQGEAIALNNIGEVYYLIGSYTEALRYYEQALEIERDIEDVASEASSLGNIGRILKSLGHFADALDHYEESLELCREIGNVSGEAISLYNIGEVLDRDGEYDDALKCYQESLEISRKIGDVAGEATSLSSIGGVYVELGQYDDAVEVLKDSIAISEKLGKLESVWRAYRTLGLCLWKSKKPEEAVEPYKKSIEAIEKLYLFIKGLKEEERSTMIGEKSYVFQEFIELLLELHEKNPKKGHDKEAFVISEKTKSRIFQELMAKASARIEFSAEQAFKELIEREKQLSAEVENYRQKLIQEKSKPYDQQNEEVISSTEEQLKSAERALREHIKELDSQYPRYADLKRTKPMSVEDLQQVLKPEETVLSYGVGKEKTAAFVIGKMSFKLVGIDAGSSELDELVKEFRWGLDNVMVLAHLKDFSPELAYALYQKIFYPVSKELKGIGKLYISADDVLYTLPFEALVDREIDLDAFDEAERKGRDGEGDYFGEYGTLHYLVDTYAITYLPSASVLRSLRKYKKTGYGGWEKSLVAFADPIFSADELKTDESEVGQRGVNRETEISAEVLTRSIGGELSRLEDSAKEAQAIAEELKGKADDIYLRERATEENLHSAGLNEAKYLLFSTHGLLGGDFSGVAEPALALTLINNPAGRDGFLCMSEVLGLDLNAEMTVLSACNTYGSPEKAGSGEGFAGLTRSFMYAGTKSILVTHWSVDSQAARDLMVGTFAGMKELGRSEALRAAKLKMKASSREMEEVKLSLSHPFFWAPFVLVGESEK